MSFISFDFYIFLVIMIALYYIFPRKIRWIVLLVGSLAFYWYISGFSESTFLILILSSLVCWLFGRFIGGRSRYKKLALTVSVIVTAVPLLAIKEAPLISAMTEYKILPECWIAPIGIAFFSLQMIAYVVDVYRNKISGEKNFFKFLLFVSFFPQIIQGPIPRYEQLGRQLTAGNPFNEKNFVKGFMLILWGFFLKLCIADKAGVVVDQIFDNYPTYCGMYVLIAGILYSFQLYADFLACTTLAQGIAGLFGIEIINNFKRPYLSGSVKEFWRRWHISLSFWLRDYIYIPLGGNRKGKIRKYINILITFAVSGIWHGAGYKYLFWGGYYTAATR